MLSKLFRKVTKPARDLMTDTAADISAETTRKVAEKGIEQSVDMFFAGVEHVANRMREASEEMAAQGLYLLKGGLVIEFKATAQRVNKRSDDLLKKRSRGQNPKR